MFKVVEIAGGFGLAHLATAERPDVAVGPGQVRLAMHAAALNYRDLMMVRGEYNPKQHLPLVPCSDGVGIVVEVGPGVERVRIGDRVAPIFAQRWLAGRPTLASLRSTLGGPLDGTLTRSMVLDAEGVVPVPEHLTHEEAATLPCAALTAWSALVEHGNVRAGETVLIQGTGGVSLFALQFARLLGARVVLTSSSDKKLEMGRALGAWQTINYLSQPDWGRQAAKLCGDEGVDLVVEVGGGKTLEQSLMAVRPGGRVCLIGVLSGGTSELTLARVFMRQIRVQGVFVGHRAAFEEMNRAIAAHLLRPAVSRIFAFDEAPAAFEHMERGGHFGKIAIRLV